MNTPERTGFIIGAALATLICILGEFSIDHVRPMRVVSSVLVMSECNAQPTSVVITFNDGTTMYNDATMPAPPQIVQDQVLGLPREDKHVFVISCPTNRPIQNDNRSQLLAEANRREHYYF